MKVDLAEEGQQGLVWFCGGCDDVHVRWQNITVTMTREQFDAFSRMTAKAGAKLAETKPPCSSPAKQHKGGEQWLQ